MSETKRPGTIANSWKRIDAWLKANAPRWKVLKKGATEEQLAKVEAKLGFALPRELRESYLIHDGSDDAGFFPTREVGYYLMPLAELEADWNMMKELLEAGDLEDGKAKGDPGVRGEWWNVGWIPFASDGGGDYWCIDLAPAKGGKKGQVIAHAHDAGKRKLLAPSLRQWLARFADNLEAGKWRHDEDEGLC
jgi:cell wall assembly regulator SMI1